MFPASRCHTLPGGQCHPQSPQKEPCSRALLQLCPSPRARRLQDQGTCPPRSCTSSGPLGSSLLSSPTCFLGLCGPPPGFFSVGVHTCGLRVSSEGTGGQGAGWGVVRAKRADRAHQGCFLRGTWQGNQGAPFEPDLPSGCDDVCVSGKWVEGISPTVCLA